MTREILYTRFQCPAKYPVDFAPVEFSPTVSARRRVTQRFPTRIIRGSPAPFAFPPSSVFFFHSFSPFLLDILLDIEQKWCSISSKNFFLEKKFHLSEKKIGKKIPKKQKSSQIFIGEHIVTGGAIGAHIIRESGLSLCV
jgi:hypothetical protein